MTSIISKFNFEYIKYKLNKNNLFNRKKILNKEEIIEILDKGIFPSVEKDDFIKYRKEDLILTRHLSDINGRSFALFCIYREDKYIIYDLNKNGFGMLESGNTNSLNDLNLKLQSKKLHYIFPSIIVTDLKNKDSCNDEIKKILHSPFLYFENEYENEKSIINQVEKDIDYYEYLESDYEISKIIDDEYFLKIYDGNKIYYGGNQAWFDKKNLINRGCGIVAAANITAYMSKEFDVKENLYSYETFSKSNFIKHMYDINEYIRPTIIGVPTLKVFSKGIEDFAKSRGIQIKANWESDKIEKEDFAEYIKSGLNSNLPVAYLQYYNSKKMKYNWHWMTITKYYKNIKNGSTSIVVSTWGEKRVLNFDALWSGNLAFRVLYFE